MNDLSKRVKSLTQKYTEDILRWLQGRSEANNGRISVYINADISSTFGLERRKYGRFLGNVQSRLDFACYLLNLPPLGLTAETPYRRAWFQDDRQWRFPVRDMQIAAQSRVWTPRDFDLLLRETVKLPGLARIIWRQALKETEEEVRAWAEALAERVENEVLEFRGGDPDDPSMADKLAAWEKKYLGADPKVTERLSKFVERGSVGYLVKKAVGFKCQLCEALGMHPIGFVKKGGEPYVEAHHMMPVSRLEVGSLAASNIVCLCANHHRQIHYGAVEVSVQAAAFDLVVDGIPVQIPRLAIKS